MSFDALGLPPALLANLAALGYAQATPVQAAALPPALAGSDVIAQAKTGSGKTAAFGIPLLLKLNPRFFAVQALVLCPTRELADQVAKELRRLARFVDNTKVLVLGGGVAIGPQIGSLAHGAHVVVGTPGRVLQHLQKGTLRLDSAATLVLDEADRMLDMGFRDDIAAICAQLPRRRQVLLFSATWPEDIRRLSRNFQRTPVEVTVDVQHDDLHIEQHFFEAEHRQRASATVALLRHYRPASVVLFCNTKQLCDDVLDAVRGAGFPAAALHGDLDQRERDRTLVQFANGSCPLLVATDVAARGLDIKGLAAVINVELAFDAEVHVHRIGRTGRAGETGLALSLCAPGETHRMNAIEQLLGQALALEQLPVPRDVSPPAPPRRVTLNIGGGRKDKLRPGDILGALTKDAGLPGDAIGKIDIFDMQAYVAVDRAVAQKALQAVLNGRIKARSFKARLL